MQKYLNIYTKRNGGGKMKYKKPIIKVSKIVIQTQGCKGGTCNGKSRSVFF